MGNCWRDPGWQWGVTGEGTDCRAGLSYQGEQSGTGTGIRALLPGCLPGAHAAFSALLGSLRLPLILLQGAKAAERLAKSALAGPTF